MFSRGIHSVNSGLRALVVAASLLSSSAALADAVTDWSVFADSLALGGPPQGARTKAIMYVAMHDALNSIEPHYESYTDVPRARRGASPDAAVGEAAYRALKGAAPATLGGSIDAFYNTWYLERSGCPNAGCADGVEGRRVGRQCHLGVAQCGRLRDAAFAVHAAAGARRLSR